MERTANTQTLEFNPISPPIARFVLGVSAFVSAFGVYFLCQITAENYPVIVVSGALFVPWLPFWFLLYRSSRIRFTADRIIKSSLLGKREMLKAKIQFFGVVYRERDVFRIIAPEDAVPFTLNGNCQIFLSEKPAHEVRGTQLETIKIPFERDVYEKIKAWWETSDAHGAGQP